MKSLILFSLILLGLLFAKSTTAKIEDSQKHLSATTTQKKKASRKLSQIAKDIKATQGDIEALEKKIMELEENKERSEQEYANLKEDLGGYEKNLAQISNNLDSKRAVFIRLLSEQFSIVFAMEQANHEPTKESIFTQEVYKAYQEHNKEELTALKSDIIALKKNKQNTQYLRRKTKREIRNIIKERKLFARQKEEKEKLRKRLEADEEKYSAKLNTLEDTQNYLRTTLARLNILRTQEVEKAREEAERRKEELRKARAEQRRIRRAKELARARALAAKKALQQAKTQEEKKQARLASIEAEKEQERVSKESAYVKQVNSSYNKARIYAYRGKKTISPIRGAKLVKRFGTYEDPIYKMKIFNESITLRAPEPNAKVQNVLNGKVVFSGHSVMLGKVVVVAHSGKMHTVYAGLSKIAPTIHVGSKIRKGYVVGKVHKKLVFQATVNSKHINPMRLIVL